MASTCGKSKKVALKAQPSESLMFLHVQTSRVSESSHVSPDCRLLIDCYILVIRSWNAPKVLCLSREVAVVERCVCMDLRPGQ